MKVKRTVNRNLQTEAKPAQAADGPARSMLRKLTPTAMLPTGNALRGVSAEQMQRLRRILADSHEVVIHSAFKSAGAPKLYENARPLVEKLHTLGSSIPHHENTHYVPKIKALTLADERTLFLAYNYARYQVIRTLREHAERKLSAAAMHTILDWDAVATRVCEAVVQANLGLVPTMVERSRVVGVDFADLISEGHLALLRSISKFDCSKGFKFSTYACRSILTSIIRSVALMARHRAHFPTEFDPDMQRADVVDFRRTAEQADEVSSLKNVLTSNRAELSRIEMKVLFERFGVTFGASPLQPLAEQKTLREVAAVFGVTKERVRQIQNKALDKLRDAIDGGVPQIAEVALK